MVTAASNSGYDFRRDCIDKLVMTVAANENHKMLVYEELTGRDTSEERGKIAEVASSAPSILALASEESAAKPSLLADTEAAIAASPTYIQSTLEEAAAMVNSTYSDCAAAAQKYFAQSTNLFVDGD